jgi:outer membrane protein OmpA-like peptidoglycan-associated protein
MSLIARLSGALALGLLTLAPRAAEAQGFTLSRFDPAPAGDRMFGVPSPFVAGKTTLHAALLAEYAHRELGIRLEQPGGDTSYVGAVVAHRLLLHGNLNLALWNRLGVNLEMPVALLQKGDDPSALNQTYVSPTSAQQGDLRLGLRLRLFGEYHDPFQVALGGSIWLPTGPKSSFMSDGKVHGYPHVIVGGELAKRAVWSAVVGPDLRGESLYAGVTEGMQVRFGAGVGFLVDEKKHLQLGAELYGNGNLGSTAQVPNAEVLLDARYRVVDDVEIGAGIGPGLSKSVGTPDVRAVAMIAYTPEQKVVPPDRDKDGILDAQDACPDVPGIKHEDAKKNGCPSDRDNDGIVDAQDACPDVVGVPSKDPKKNGCPPDRDNDGIVDAEDACPDVVGVKSADPKKNGCPSDRDEDGIVDAQDACPDLKGVASKDPAQNGCPPDTDGDGIRDDQDACPQEKGVADPDPKKNGCPRQVRVTQTEIVILQQVQFDTAKATIKPVSNPLLDEVAGVLKDHREITKIEVQGHTDDVGAKTLNQKLSQSRATAVMAALVKRGIDAGRLTAKGYGQEQPVADNKTADGRQANRRVQFKIMEKKAQP